MKVHFIAIGGSAMHNLAIALHKKGFEVTGSDDVIFEPSVTKLAKHGLLPKEYGWYPDKITSDLDAVILGMHARPDNPELLAAQQAGLKIYSYPEYIYEQSKDKLRVVIGGSHGKTSITSMILHALQSTGKAFDYLVGAQLEGFDTMVGLSDAPLMIIEGDEYLSSPIDRRPKFHLYRANLAVISGIAWDHINVFPTFENYIEQFAKFIDTMEPNGTLFFAGNDEVLKKVIADDDSTIQKFAYNAPAYQVNDGITSVLIDGSEYELQIFGQHNLFNLEAARNICNQLGIATNDFYSSMRTFKGAARRLELLGKSDSTNIYKDFAHSPSKLKATIHAVKTQFPERKLVACMELHTFSSLNKNFLGEYAGCMDEADTAIIFIHSETFFHKKMQPYEESFVRSTIKRQDLIYFDQPEKLKEYLEQQKLTGTNLLLMSSGNFGGLDLTALTEKVLS